MNKANFALPLALVALALTACSSDQPAPSPPSSSAEGPAMVAYPMPDLGPSPAPSPMSDAEREQARLDDADRRWATLLLTYPAAVRPEVAFEGYLDVTPMFARIKSCLYDHGVPVDEGTDAMSGELVSVSGIPSTQQQAIDDFACVTATPFTPAPPVNAEQLAYLYDYLTQYIVPCYEANGVTDIPAAPTKQFFVDNWPNQNWFPSGVTDEVDVAFTYALEDACPMVDLTP